MQNAASQGAAVLSEEGRDIETSEASSDRNATCVAEPSVAKTSAKGLTAFLVGIETSPALRTEI